MSTNNCDDAFACTHYKHEEEGQRHIWQVGTSAGYEINVSRDIKPPRRGWQRTRVRIALKEGGRWKLRLDDKLIARGKDTAADLEFVIDEQDGYTTVGRMLSSVVKGFKKAGDECDV